MGTDIYGAGPIEPVARIKDWVEVWSQGAWTRYQVEYIEPLPRSQQLVQDFGAVAANGSVVTTLVNNLRLDDNHLLQVRFAPLDDVECALWLQSGQARYYIKFVQDRVSLYTGILDPYWATTQFFILGKDRDPYIQVFRRGDYAATVSRVAFWGFRYILTGKQAPNGAPAIRIPAEGRAA